MSDVDELGGEPEVRRQDQVARALAAVRVVRADPDVLGVDLEAPEAEDLDDRGHVRLAGDPRAESLDRV